MYGSPSRVSVRKLPKNKVVSWLCRAGNNETELCKPELLSGSPLSHASFLDALTDPGPGPAFTPAVLSCPPPQPPCPSASASCPAYPHSIIPFLSMLTFFFFNALLAQSSASLTGYSARISSPFLAFSLTLGHISPYPSQFTQIMSTPISELAFSDLPPPDASNFGCNIGELVSNKVDLTGVGPE